MLLKIILIVIFLVSLAFLGLGIQIFFSKKKKFPQTHIGENENMKKLNISCAKHVNNIEFNTCTDECKTCC